MSNLVSATIAAYPEGCWMKKLSDRFRNMVINILRNVIDPEGDHRLILFEIIYPQERTDELLGWLRGEGIVNEGSVMVSKGGRIYGLARVKCRLACGICETTGCILRKVNTNISGEVEWHIVGTAAAYKSLISRLKKRGIRFKICEMRRLNMDRSLTGRQELVVKLALEMGYFDCPKRMGITELSELLQITPATLSEMLRKGLKKILMEYFSFVEAELFGGLNNNNKKTRLSQYSIIRGLSQYNYAE